MKPIHSGTTTERLVRAVLLVILVNVFAGWYLWDGHVGYPRANARGLIELLGLEASSRPLIHLELTKEAAGRFIRDFGDQAGLDKVKARFGPPAIEHDENLYFLGPGGHLCVTMNAEGAAKIRWSDGRYNESELKSQRGIGYVLGAIGLVVIAHLVRVLATRVSLTDEGLKIGRKPMITFDAITGLRTPDEPRGDAVVVEFVVNGRPGTVSLDSYVIKEQRAIVEAIRRRKGLADATGSSAGAGNTGEGP